MARTITRIKEQINYGADSIQICHGCLKRSAGFEGLKEVLMLLEQNKYVFQKKKVMGHRTYHIFTRLP